MINIQEIFKQKILNKKPMDIIHRGYSEKIQKKIGKVLSIERENSDKEKILKSEILAYYKNQIESKRLREYDIDKKRIFDHMKSFGLQPTEDVLFVKKEDFEPIIKILKKHNYSSWMLSYDKKSHWFHNYILNISFVILDVDKNIIEKEVSLMTEWTTVHEMCHSARWYFSKISIQKKISRKNLWRKDNTTTFVHSPRAWLSTKNIAKNKIYGNFLEEWFARYIAKEYIQKFRSLEISEKIEEAKTKTKWISKYLENGRLFIDKNNENLCYNSNDYMWMWMEILFKKRPELLQAFIQARNANGKDGKPLQDIARIINSFPLPPLEKNGKIVSRSLYNELRKLQYNENDAKKGFNLIQEATGKRD